VVSDKGYLRQVQDKIHQLGMAKSVHHLGYISNSEMVAAYKRCTAVVFASIAGPTNIPPIEAIYLEVPLVCSNAYAMADQVGDAGLLFDPYNPRDMADKIQLAWENQGVREQLRARCGERRKLLNRSLYAERWREIVLSAATILAREGPGSRAAAASRQKRPSGLPSASEIQP
jgi:glycosyltransferase involved in cell wall biosynthesis